MASLMETQKSTHKRPLKRKRCGAGSCGDHRITSEKKTGQFNPVKGLDMVQKTQNSPVRALSTSGATNFYLQM